MKADGTANIEMRRIHVKIQYRGKTLNNLALKKLDGVTFFCVVVVHIIKPEMTKNTSTPKSPMGYGKYGFTATIAIE
jgi:hypothetical protein